MENEKIKFLLDLFEAEYKKSYLSCMDFFSLKNDSYTRIEMILPNVGRLCLYQNFIELPDGEQVPNNKLFYTIYDKPNIRTIIKDRALLSRALKIIYGCKKYYEQNPAAVVSDTDVMLSKIIKTKNLAYKVYKQNLSKQTNRFIHGYQK